MRRVALLTLALAVACSAELPEPDDPGAVALRERCGTCHRLYHPGAMTLEMWKIQIDRKHRMHLQRGLPWFSPSEERAVMDYLARHAGTQ